jgi:hypothetical protein
MFSSVFNTVLSLYFKHKCTRLGNILTSRGKLYHNENQFCLRSYWNLFHLSCACTSVKSWETTLKGISRSSSEQIRSLLCQRPQPLKPSPRFRSSRGPMWCSAVGQKCKWMDSYVCAQDMPTKQVWAAWPQGYTKNSMARSLYDLCSKLPQSVPAKYYSSLIFKSDIVTHQLPKAWN